MAKLSKVVKTLTLFYLQKSWGFPESVLIHGSLRILPRCLYQWLGLGGYFWQANVGSHRRTSSRNGLAIFQVCPLLQIFPCDLWIWFFVWSEDLDIWYDIELYYKTMIYISIHRVFFPVYCIPFYSHPKHEDDSCENFRRILLSSFLKCKTLGMSQISRTSIHHQ